MGWFAYSIKKPWRFLMWTDFGSCMLKGLGHEIESKDVGEK
jgi:hypothetical protein